MWVHSHTSSSIWCVCVRECMLGKCFIQMAYSRLLQQWAPSVAFSPYQVLSAQLWFDFYVSVCVCMFVSMCPFFVSLLDLPQTVADRHNLHAHWILLYTDTYTHMRRLEDKWTLLTHRQRCGQAAFPFECSAKPQATITLVPVCLTAAEIECCVFAAPWAAGWWCVAAGVWHCRVVFARYSLQKTQGSYVS